jgi:hypothetical protein
MTDALTYTSIIPGLVPTVLQGPVGERLVGSFAALADGSAENGRHALRAPLVGDSLTGGIGPATDALGLIGEELRLPRYPPEDDLQYHRRLNGAWASYQRAGDELELVSQLAASGFPGAVIYTAHEWPAVPGPAGEVPYWSQFWVVFDGDNFPLFTPASRVGFFTVGDSTVVGLGGIAPGQVTALRGIVKKWKPAHWINRGIVFVFGGWLVGDGHTVGDSGLLVSGATGVI